MAMYPSLEDMMVDTQAHAAVLAEKKQMEITQGQGNNNGAIQSTNTGGMYAGLGLEELLGYGGLDISPQAIQEQMGKELAISYTNPNKTGGYQPLAKITNDNNLGMARSEKKEGIRPVTLCKNEAGKVGFAPAAIDKGIFCAFVWKDSPAALAGIRFGDQILAINGTPVAGWTSKQVIQCFNKASTNGIMLAIRDRPYARTITFQKDSKNHVGFILKKGEVDSIIKDTSAARNGLLIKHFITEVNGQNVVGMTDKDMIATMQSSPVTITLTVMPKFVYKHLVDKISFKKLKEYMDHSIPEI